MTKRAASLNPKAVSALVILFMFLGFQPANSAQLLTTLNSTCIGTSGTSSWSAAMPFNVPETATVTKIDYKLSAGTATDAYILIKRDNAGAPTGTTLGTFTFSSITSTIATFTGSAALNGAGRFWIVFRQVSIVDMCFAVTANTTGSAQGWTMGTTFTFTSGDSGATYTSRGDYITLLFAMYGTGGGVLPPISSISLSSNTLTTYRQEVALTASLGVLGTDGRVTFYAAGKKIPGCINKQSISLVATCNWKPSHRGSVAITARLVPANSEYPTSVSQVKTIAVQSRTNQR